MESIENIVQDVKMIIETTKGMRISDTKTLVFRNKTVFDIKRIK